MSKQFNSHFTSKTDIGTRIFSEMRKLCHTESVIAFKPWHSDQRTCDINHGAKCNSEN